MNMVGPFISGGVPNLAADSALTQIAQGALLFAPIFTVGCVLCACITVAPLIIRDLASGGSPMKLVQTTYSADGQKLSVVVS